MRADLMIEDYGGERSPLARSLYLLHDRARGEALVAALLLLGAEDSPGDFPGVDGLSGGRAVVLDLSRRDSLGRLGDRHTVAWECRARGGGTIWHIDSGALARLLEYAAERRLQEPDTMR